MALIRVTYPAHTLNQQVQLSIFKILLITLQVSSGQTVQGLKEILAMQIAIPVEEQKLVFKGKALGGMYQYEYQFGKSVKIIQKFKIETCKLKYTGIH